MEKSIFQYLEFLLPIHNCVIIPEFGGFIINMKPSKFDTDSNINQPEYSIVFNPELKHDDGLIASYIVKNKGVSYNTASKEIRSFVKELVARLKSGEIVLCGNIGCLSHDQSGNTIFSANNQFIHPDYYGLEPLKLRQLNSIPRKIIATNKKSYIRHTIGGVAAAVAALLLFVGPSINIKDQTGNVQQADFLSSITTSLVSSDIKKKLDQVINIDSTQNEIEKPLESVKPISTRTYYIIIGGEEDETRANRLLDKIHASDFPGASIIKSQDRYRIYISSFEDKKEAESFLDSFRKEHPKYDSAWLFSKRNN
ncbi:SPOR domain-containing protein [Dysgonomonas sp. Marseille-P4361]|uniref:HU domain-containing protein n=1 Tax=Dysgonomonas sp. Marseille-P4361 TaxID=2161820 RepID=UPI000D55D8A8|nr:SPOR domain-containing protein [Dysgonomonas sp. Marseille-P4361]